MPSFLPADHHWPATAWQSYHFSISECWEELKINNVQHSTICILKTVGAALDTNLIHLLPLLHNTLEYGASQHTHEYPSPAVPHIQYYSDSAVKPYRTCFSYVGTNLHPNTIKGKGEAIFIDLLYGTNLLWPWNTRKMYTIVQRTQHIWNLFSRRGDVLGL